MISFKQKGDWEKTREALMELTSGDIFSDLEQYGELGIQALSGATPVRTGQTASSWAYRVIRDQGRPGIEWYNTNVVAGGTSVAILIQYGHGTGTGGYVAGLDYINPAMRPIFQEIADEVWKKVMT